MNKCYKCTENLCDIILDCNGNGQIVLPYLAPLTAEYKLFAKFRNKYITFVETIEVENPFIFNVSGLNENYCYKLHIKNISTNELIEFGEYNNWNICTTQEYLIQS